MAEQSESTEASEPCLCGTDFTCLASDHDESDWMPLSDYLNQPALSVCSECERSTWSPSEVGGVCGMAQPSGERCGGIFPTPASTPSTRGLSEAERWELYDNPAHASTEAAVEHIVAAREAAAATRARAEALREAADFCEATIATALGSVRNDFADGWRDASGQILDELRARADSPAGGDR